MSALEQIRKRPVLIISILGLALVLFILTAVSHPEDLVTDPTTIAKVDGKKIDYTAFQQRADLIREQQQAQFQQSPDSYLVQEQAMESLIAEALMQNEIERLGIVVTDEELSQAIMGENPLPMAVQTVYRNFYRMFGQPIPPQMIQEMIKNPAANNLSPQQVTEITVTWENTLADVREQLIQRKFANLLMGTLQANKLDAEQLYADNSTTNTVRYAKVDLSTVRDEEVELTDNEARQQYEADKNLYRVDEPTTQVTYIAAQVYPSDEDRQEAVTAVEDALLELRSCEGTEAVDGNLKFVVSRHNMPAAKYPASLAGQLDKIIADTVAQISFYDNKWTIAKYLGESMATDSITLDMVFVPDSARVDSVLTALNAGGNPADMGEDIQSQLDQRESLLDAEMAQLVSFLDQAPVGKYIAGSEELGLSNQMLFRVAKKDAPVKLISIAEISYKLEPSNTTIADYQGKLRAYVNENKTAQAFADNATAAGYNALPANATASTLSINGMPETTQLVKWAVNADKGEVSEVLSDADRTFFIAAAVTDKYKEYRPMGDPQVAAQVRAKALRAKKAEKLLEQYAGAKTVDALAQAASARVDTTQVTFNQNYAPGLMPGDGKAIALLGSAQQGTVAGPVATDYAVVVYEVIDTQVQPRAYDFEQDAAFFQQSQGAQTLLRNFDAILRANSKIDNKVQKFVAH